MHLQHAFDCGVRTPLGALIDLDLDLERDAEDTDPGRSLLSAHSRDHRKASSGPWIAEISRTQDRESSFCTPPIRGSRCRVSCSTRRASSAAGESLPAVPSPIQTREGARAALMSASGLSGVTNASSGYFSRTSWITYSGISPRRTVMISSGMGSKPAMPDSSRE